MRDTAYTDEDPTAMKIAFDRAGFHQASPAALERPDLPEPGPPYTDIPAFSAGSSATAAVCEQAALFGVTPDPDEFDNRPLWEAPDRIKTVPHGELTLAEQRTRRREYKARSDQDPNLHPGDPLDVPDLHAAFEDSHLPAIVYEIVDLAAEHLCPDGTKLADERESLLWGLVNCFHAQAQRLDRTLDRMEPELRDLQRAQDGSEVKSVELERLTDKAHNMSDRRDALEIYRDCASDAYRAHTGEIWRPRYGSHTSRTGNLTSAAIDARDFLRARKNRENDAHMPDGTLIAVAGGKDVGNPDRLLAVLEQAREKYRDMVLVHGAAPGYEKIAASWADTHGIQQIVCRPNWKAHGRAAPFRRNDELLNLLPKGVIAFPGTGVTENLVDKARQLGIPVHRIRA